MKEGDHLIELGDSFFVLVEEKCLKNGVVILDVFGIGKCNLNLVRR